MSADATPRPIKVRPGSHRRAGPALRRALIVREMRAETNAYVPSEMNPSTMNVAPRITACSGTEPFDTSTNCGRNARKNSAVFGFRMFTTTPWA